jgi:hypothetical protein
VLWGPDDFRRAAEDAGSFANKATEIVEIARREPMVGIPGLAVVGVVLAGLRRLFRGDRDRDWDTRGG